ncbi:DUF7693 family protein [Pseudomonas asplenii]|uniref:DUF7693 family protein n=1 Tax=Pseudomonas asplenii TaxID=53407 RepID=UPI0006B5D47D|nr:hypothetical protein [Pseudomonas fuscovaginae]
MSPSTMVGDCDEVFTGVLTTREVCQVLRDVVLGRRTMVKAGRQTGNGADTGHFAVDVEGWQITICNDGDKLDYCEQAESPDGRTWQLAPGDRYGTDPIALLSTWEHRVLEGLLRAL